MTSAKPDKPMLRGRHIASTSAASLIGGGLSFGLSLVVARALGPVQNGYYSQFVLVLNLVYIALNFGVGPASTFLAASGRTPVRDVVRANGVIIAMVSGLVAVLTWGIHLTGVATVLEHELTMPVLIFYGGVGAGMILLIFNQVVAVLMGCHRYDHVNLLNIAKGTLPLVVIAGVVGAGGSVSPIVTAHVLALLLTVIIALWSARRALAAELGASATDQGVFGVVESMFTYGWIVYTANLLHYLSMRGVLLLISYYAGPSAVGFLTLALLLVEAVLLFPSAIGQLLFPQASTAAFNRTTFERVLRLNVFLSLIAVALFWPVSRLLVILVLGGTYQQVAELLVHLLPSIVLLTGPRLLSQVLSGQGYPGYPLLAAIASVVVGTVVAVVGIRRWGVTGAAWVINGTSAITMMITVWGYTRVHGAHVREIFRPRREDWVVLLRALGWWKVLR